MPEQTITLFGGQESLIPSSIDIDAITEERDKQLELDRLSRELVGFQSYEWFVNDGQAKDAFLNDDQTDNPHLNYTKLDGITEEFERFKEVIPEIINNEPDSEKKKIIEASLNYRLAEVAFVKDLAELSRLRQDGSQEEIDQLVKRIRKANEELYGLPDKKTVEKVHNELADLTLNKELAPSAEKIRREMVDMFSKFDIRLKADNQEERLPIYKENEALNWFGEIILEQNSDIKAFVDEYWDAAVEEEGKDYACDVDDMIQIFKEVVAMRDPKNELQIEVVKENNASSLSWSSKDRQIRVGENRPTIDSADELFKKVMHEFGVHGQRAINGARLNNSALANGLNTELDAECQRSSYLPFEEGLGVTTEVAIGIKKPKWSAVSLAAYINVDLADRGANFRQVFELGWRYRLISKMKPGEEPTEEMINKERDKAYNSCIRIFRGTQPDMENINPPLFFSKDIAYLDGKIMAIDHLEDLYSNQDKDGVGYLFAAKFDPTIPEQDKIVKSILASHESNATD